MQGRHPLRSWGSLKCLGCSGLTLSTQLPDLWGLRGLRGLRKSVILGLMHKGSAYWGLAPLFECINGFP